MQRPVFITDLDDRLRIHGADRAQIDDFGLDSFLFEFGGGLQRIGHADRPGDDRDIPAHTRNPRLADRHQEIVELRHFERMAVENFVFEENHRIGIADRALQKPLGIGGRIRRDDLEAGDLRVPGGEILRVLRRDARRRPVGAAKHDLRQPIWPPDI